MLLVGGLTCADEAEHGQSMSDWGPAGAVSIGISLHVEPKDSDRSGEIANRRGHDNFIRQSVDNFFRAFSDDINFIDT
jgi:hypothetical protein